MHCFQDLPKVVFSKRQYNSIEGKCINCIAQLEPSSTSSVTSLSSSNSILPLPVNKKWTFDCYYRVCHRGSKNKGVTVRSKCNVGSPIIGYIALGKVFRGTEMIHSEQGDPMVKLENLSIIENTNPSKKPSKDAWIPCRSIRNEIFLEKHSGPMVGTATRFYRCMIEGCKVRLAPDLELPEIGYLLYGDVVEVTDLMISKDGIVFLQLHDRYFDGAAWVVERTLDNESVLNPIEGPNICMEEYRCVQESGAPTRSEPSLSSPPIGRIPCGSRVTVLERYINPQRQLFLRIHSLSSTLWVIETSTCCASVMIKIK
jgi:hypothetical protein